MNENNLYIRVLKFGEENPKGFNYKKIKDTIKLNDWEENILLRYLYNAVLNNSESNKTLHETMFMEIRIDSNREDKFLKFYSIPSDINESEKQKIETAIQKSVFTLKYDAYFNYIDFRELQEALKTSKEAKWYAIGAIIIAIITGILQFNAEQSTLWNFLSNNFCN